MKHRLSGRTILPNKRRLIFPPSRTQVQILINCVKREIGFAAYLSRGVNSSLLRAGERRDEDLRIDKKVAGGRSRRNSEKILEPVPYKLGDDCFPAGVFKPDVHGSATVIQIPHCPPELRPRHSR